METNVIREGLRRQGIAEAIKEISEIVFDHVQSPKLNGMSHERFQEAYLKVLIQGSLSGCQ